MTKRVLANVALSYVAAGIVTFVFLVILELLTPSSIGNMLTGWVYEMCLLAWGSPAVLVVLAIVDLALTAVGDRRRSGFVFSLLPGALTALLIVPYPAIAPLVVWLLAVGLLFGRVMRLPKRAPATEPTR